ncbi:hypothetical protein AB0B45_02635 [Nonomuraea sp. NPDC049152]|uniref:hypothetical protein n=1 Tax=Nonomuraea sp. NPDC049152 TaxID=3154350 RepID=UPI0033DDD446
MTPPSTELPTEQELTNYIGALKPEEPQHPYEAFPERRRPSHRGGPALESMFEDEYRFGWFGQADYDGGL